jgi:N-acetyl-anhydromuramyl-L-alanine amidase AmpD
VAVNCGAIPEHLLEAEFFGYRKGAFTGAQEDRAGFFQAAHGGTLFLDEIGDLPLAMQSKLLRVIQERAVRPVGAVSETPLNVRIVSATHKDLAAEVRPAASGRICSTASTSSHRGAAAARAPAGSGRHLPGPARAHRARCGGLAFAQLSAEARARLSRYHFPGNVRELENLLHRAVALSTHEVIEAGDLGLPETLLGSGTVRPCPCRRALADRRVVGRQRGRALPTDLAAYLDEVERAILVRALPAWLQPHGRRRQPGAVAAADALPHGPPGHHRRERRPDGRNAMNAPAAPAGEDWQAGWWSGARPCPRRTSAPARRVAIDLVVLHSISLPPGEYGGDGIVRLFTNTLDWSAHPYYEGIRGLEVSAHFVIRRDGELLQFVSCDDRAWHAGRSAWQGRENCNDYAIGIELEGLEGRDLRGGAVRHLARLLQAMARAYPVRAVVGHEHVAPGRKCDPGAGFDWERVARLTWLGWAWPQARPTEAGALQSGIRVLRYR